MSLQIPDYLLGGVIQGVSMGVRERQARGHGVPPTVLAAHRWLAIMSAVGHESSSDEAQLSEDDLIGTAEAASLLGCSARHVRRLRADLDGAQPSGTHLVFSRRSVIRYAEQREDHRRELAERSNHKAEQRHR